VSAAGHYVHALRWLALAGLVLAVLVFAVHLPALGASFQFDDYRVIVRDARVQSLAAWWQSMPGMRAVLKLTFALNHAAGGSVQGFRIVNIALHALNTVLVLVLLWRLSSRRGHDSRTALVVAVAATVVFALHPVQTEAVTYVSGRSMSLAATFCLLALLAWDRARMGGAVGWRWAAAAAALLALGTKEMAAALPLLLALWAWLDTTGDHRCLPAAPAARAWQAARPLLLLCLAVAAGLALLPVYRDLLASSLALRGPLANLLTQTVALPWLAGQFLGLAPLNADPDLRPVTGVTLDTGLRAAAILGVLAAAVALRRRAPAATFAVLWFTAWLLPTHSLLPREDPANDRHLYLALIGPAWALADALLRSARLQRPVVFTLLLAALGIALGHATLERNRVYATEISFWQDVVRHSPHKVRGWNNLGYAYALACRDADAARAFARAMALDPADSRPRINRLLLARGALPRAAGCGRPAPGTGGAAALPVSEKAVAGRSRLPATAGHARVRFTAVTSPSRMTGHAISPTLPRTPSWRSEWLRRPGQATSASLPANAKRFTDTV
jgi:hypothetical protein